jgi:hypothetical protein
MEKEYHFAEFSLLGGPIQTFTAEKFLYPQYDDKFEKFKTASKEWLQTEARKLLKVRRGSPEVLARWQAIADGSFFEKK